MGARFRLDAVDSLHTTAAQHNARLSAQMRPHARLSRSPRAADGCAYGFVHMLVLVRGEHGWRHVQSGILAVQRQPERASVGRRAA